MSSSPPAWPTEVSDRTSLEEKIAINRTAIEALLGVHPGLDGEESDFVVWGKKFLKEIVSTLSLSSFHR